jgi:hypothetical protein
VASVHFVGVYAIAQKPLYNTQRPLNGWQDKLWKNADKYSFLSSLYITEEMKKLLLACLLGTYSLTTSAQEVINQMTRDRTVGYLEEILNEIKGHKSCDTCNKTFMQVTFWILQEGDISVNERVKYTGDDKFYITSYRFNPAVIDTLILSAGPDDIMTIELKFSSNCVWTQTQNTGNKVRQSSYINKINLHFLKGDGKNEDRIRETLLHLKDLYKKEKTGN